MASWLNKIFGKKAPRNKFTWKKKNHNDEMRKRVVQEPLNMSIYSYFPTPKKGSTRRANNIWNINWNKAQKYPANNKNLLNLRHNNRNLLNLSGNIRGPSPPSRTRNRRIPNNPFNMFNNVRPVKPNIHELFAPRQPANFSAFDPFTGSTRFNENAFKRGKTRKTNKAKKSAEGLVKALKRHGIRVPRQLPRNLR